VLASGTSSLSLSEEIAAEDSSDSRHQETSVSQLAADEELELAE